MRKCTVIKSYMCVLVSLSVKVVHLEPVSDLTTEASIASLRRFIARRWKPSLIFSDHGSNFVGLLETSANCVNFFKNRNPRRSSSISVQPKTLNGSTFLREHLTLEVCRKLL